MPDMANIQQVMAELGRLHMENLEIRAVNARLEEQVRDLTQKLEARKPKRGKIENDPDPLGSEQPTA